MAVASDRPHTVVAWDLPTRLFHWLLVALVVSAWISFQYAEQIGDHRLRWHRANGVAVVILLLWRVMWGFAGSSTSRFASFLYSPIAAAQYGGRIFVGRTQRFLGHNPLGAYVVFALLAIAMTQASLGLFTVEHNDIAAGPLYRLVTEEATKLASRWHRVLFYYVLLPAVALHVTANVLYGLVKREPLIAAMITGRKPTEAVLFQDAQAADVPKRPLVRAALLLALSAGIVLGPVYAVSGRFY